MFYQDVSLSAKVDIQFHVDIKWTLLKCVDLYFVVIISLFPKARMYNFADDTSLLAVGEDPNITTGILNMDLQKISNWADKSKVTFNP